MAIMVQSEEEQLKKERLAEWGREKGSDGVGIFFAKDPLEWGFACTKDPLIQKKTHKKTH